MCGLFGLVGLQRSSLSPSQVDAARAARDVLQHRGPDQLGEHIDGNVFIGHRRLSIIDLSELGRQPMVSKDGRFAVTVNGEIYNYAQLRKQIGEHEFISQSDSEVVLHGIRQWGLQPLLEKLEGIFALAIYDREQRKVYLARDLAGVKPVYYGRRGDDFVWASELKAARQYFGAGSLSMDETALYDYLTYRYIPAPKTLYKEMFKLEPGCWLEFSADSGQMRSGRYWSLDPVEQHSTIDQAAEKVRHVIGESVAAQMVSDVPLGAFLSGGIDSSIIVSEASQQTQGLATYTIGYREDSHDESAFAERVARACQTQFYLTMLSADDGVDLLDQLQGWYDEPFADTSALPSWHVSREARKSATVVLTGDGGDELFGGYLWYKRFQNFEALRKIWPSMLRRGYRGHASSHTGLARKLLSRWDLLSCRNSLELYAVLMGAIIGPRKDRFRQMLELPEDYDELWLFRKFYRPDLSPLKRMQFLDFHTYLPNDILTKVDRVTMAVGLEARVPFLGREVIETAFSLPDAITYHAGQLKGILKYAYKGRLPDEVLFRKKQGFSIPIHQWDASLREDSRRVVEMLFERYWPPGIQPAAGGQP